MKENTNKRQASVMEETKKRHIRCKVDETKTQGGYNEDTRNKMKRECK